jgi:hypothetical protein
MNRSWMLLPWLFLSVIGCHKDNQEETAVVPDVTVTAMDVLPKDIMQTQICDTLVTDVSAFLPDGADNKHAHSDLFDMFTAQKIVIKKDADIFVTFVTSNTSKNNAIGFYAYSDSLQPSNSTVQKHLIFPNASVSVLQKGATIHIGKFKKGSLLGFYIMDDAWNTVKIGLDESKPLFYTDQYLNANNEKTHVLLFDKKCGQLVIGFEDDMTGSSDNDYNDVILIVSDNSEALPSVSFDDGLIPRI